MIDEEARETFPGLPKAKLRKGLAMNGSPVKLPSLRGSYPTNVKEVAGILKM